MARYRKRSVEVDAEQWQPGRAIAGVSVEDGMLSDRGFSYVTTAAGQRLYLAPGDYVVQYPDGHRTVVSEEAFGSIFEAVAE